MVGGIGQAGRWWLALVVVCAVGLLAFGALAFLSRPLPKPDPAARTAAGTSPATPGDAAASTATPAGGVSPSPVQAGLISSPPPVRQSPSPRSSSPRPGPSPEPSPSPVTTPPPYLRLDPASGAATLTPTWSASACPGGYQGSAVLIELNADGSIGSRISAAIGGVTGPFSGTLDGPVGKLITLGSDVQAGATSTWVVGCFAGIGGTGAEKAGQSISVRVSADGSSYSAS